MKKENKIVLLSGWILATLFATVGATMLAKAENAYNREVDQLKYQVKCQEMDLNTAKQERDFFKTEYFKLKGKK